MPPHPCLQLSPRCVLVVDDSRDTADCLALFLHDHGLQTLVAYDGRSALALAAAHKPQLIILDIGIPGMSGFDVCAHLRSIFARDALRIFAHSGWTRPADIARAKQCGFDGYLIKPASCALLVNAVALQNGATVWPRLSLLEKEA